MRLELNSYLKVPIFRWRDKINELLDVADDLIGMTNESTYPSSDINPYYHHDMVRLYRLWKTDSWKLFQQDMTHFSEEYDFFSAPDSVPFMPLKKESPDFHLAYGFKWLENIRNEVKEKKPYLLAAKKKILRFHSGGLGITSIAVVRVREDEKSYSVILNDSKIVTMRRKSGGAGALLYSIATKTKEVNKEDYKNGYKYLNSNKNNPFYKNGAFKPTTVIGLSGDRYVAKILIKSISKETFENKKKSIG